MNNLNVLSIRFRDATAPSASPLALTGEVTRQDTCACGLLAQLRNRCVFPERLQSLEGHGTKTSTFPGAASSSAMRF